MIEITGSIYEPSRDKYFNEIFIDAEKKTKPTDKKIEEEMRELRKFCDIYNNV